MLLITVAALMTLLAGSAFGRDCDHREFAACLREVSEDEDGGDFGAVDGERLERVCRSRKRSAECAGDFIRDCLRRGERELYEATVGGRLDVVRDMCTPGTWIHTGFLSNAECFRKILGEVTFCSDKFRESQAALAQSDDLDERTKIFYGCCAFEWHRKCLSSAARAQCGGESSDFVYRVTTALGGRLQEQMCSTSYSSCHGLHGLEETPPDAGGPRAAPLTAAPLLACLLLLLMLS